MSRCVQFILGDKGKATCLIRECLWLEKRGRERGKGASARGWNMQNESRWRLRLFVRGLSNKKAESYYCLIVCLFSMRKGSLKDCKIRFGTIPSWERRINANFRADMKLLNRIYYRTSLAVCMQYLHIFCFSLETRQAWRSHIREQFLSAP